MTAFNLVRIFKSLLSFNRLWSHLRPLTQALRTRPYDLAALEALRDELTRKRREIPEGDLWRIWQLAEQALATAEAGAATPVIDEIMRDARWEVQSRQRAT